ncbi:Glycine/D-amino acid oxidase [Lishizhenia tianjinensis]|uniref:Glycine/D-amino acid oxidase n=1 Tax=Lishizhenia tianjinensis TaxID=477690 RepID=A0A1I7BDS5_9FLAO|nr:FAD-binding oxidoreductase [Lishizhenia tianjinensis]SFT85349.1 Glycine/D-amino acid oxidase [Lishizhenia tianjinensis]
MKTLIIGGGVAGLSIAHQLEKRGEDFLIITEKENHSTRVAAGMINPFVFRRMLKSWKADEFIPYLNNFYKNLEEKTGSTFFHHIPIRRLFSSEDEAKLWKERSEDPEYSSYLQLDAQPHPAYAKDTFGQGFVLKGGYIHSENFLKANRDYFEGKGLLRYESIDHQAIDIEQKSYKQEHFDFIVFAEGYKGKENPWFNYLPLGQTKGELLDISSDELSEDEILNRKCFVLPVGDQRFKLGATFDWNTTDLTPTEEKKAELLEKYDLNSTAKFTINEHITGIRPTSPDRRAFLGEHPKHKGLFVFNGLGTKGYMLAPYLSEHLLDHILNGEDLIAEVNIQRFHKRFRKQEAGEL